MNFGFFAEDLVLFWRKKLLVKEVPGWFENKVHSWIQVITTLPESTLSESLVLNTCLNSEVQSRENLNKNNSDFEEIVYYFISALVLFIIFWIKTRSSSGLKPEASQSLNFLWVLKLYINNLCLCIIPGKWKIIKASSKQQPPAIGSLHGPSPGCP